MHDISEVPTDSSEHDCRRRFCESRWCCYAACISLALSALLLIEVVRIETFLTKIQNEMSLKAYTKDVPTPEVKNSLDSLKSTMFDVRYDVKEVASHATNNTERLDRIESKLSDFITSNGIH